MKNIKFDKTFFFKSIVNYEQLEDFLGIEIAFVGYSNSGKSSIINCLTNKKKLARVSKFPGSTSTINFFNVSLDFRIIDFPGYGYTKIDHRTGHKLNKNLFFYLKYRKCLRGIVILSDIRSSLKSLDLKILKIARLRLLPVIIILTKSDKVSKKIENKITFSVRNSLINLYSNITLMSFSKFNRSNISILIEILSSWYHSSQKE